MAVCFLVGNQLSKLSELNLIAPNKEQIVDANVHAINYEKNHQAVALVQQHQQETKQEKHCEIHFSSPTIRICHMIPYGKNFGDFLGPVAAKRLLQEKFGESCSIKVPVLNLKLDKRQKGDKCLFTLGSIFQHVQTNDLVWGTGFHPIWQRKFPTYIRTYAVRGPKTEKVIKEHHLNNNRRGIPHVDPGYLIPFLYPEYMDLASATMDHWSNTATPKICFVSHFKDVEEAGKAFASNNQTVNLISCQNDWEPVVKNIAMNCTHVASTSLHGLILAEAMGIPVLWFQFVGSTVEKREGSFKYLDFFESIHRKDMSPVHDLSVVFQPDAYTVPMSLPKRTKITNKFVGSFPYDLFETRMVSTPTHVSVLPKARRKKITRENSFSCPGPKGAAGATTNTIPTNKTLVIIMGNVRGGEDGWQSLYKHVLDNNSADLALIVGETPKKYQNSSLFDRARYHWSFEEFDDWADAMDLVNGTEWRKTLLPRIHPEWGLLGGITGHSGSGGVIFMIRWFLSQCLQEHDLAHAYDRFVITRSDHLYWADHDLSKLDPNYMWIPGGESYGGMTDRHLVVSAQHVIPALDVLGSMFRHGFEGFGLKLFSNPEHGIELAWRANGVVDIVRLFPRVFFTTFQIGDPTRWNRNQAKNPFVPGIPGLHVKRADELEDTIVNTQFRHFRAIIDHDKAALSCRDPVSLISSQEEHSRNNKKTLVIYIKSLQSGKNNSYAQDSMFRNLLGVNSDTDLALLHGQGAKFPNSSLFERAKYLWSVDELEQWAIDENSNGWTKSDWMPEEGRYEKEKKNWLGGTKGYNASGTSLGVLSWFLTSCVYDLLKEQYDRLVLTQSNYYFGCPHKFSQLDPEHIWVPSGDKDNVGFSRGRHVVLSLRHLDRIREAFQSLTTAKGVTTALSFRQIWNHNIKHQVEEFPRSMFRTNEYRWRTTPKNATLPFAPRLIAYDDKEYELTKETCPQMMNVIAASQR